LKEKNAKRFLKKIKTDLVRREKGQKGGDEQKAHFGAHCFEARGRLKCLPSLAALLFPRLSHSSSSTAPFIFFFIASIQNKSIFNQNKAANLTKRHFHRGNIY